MRGALGRGLEERRVQGAGEPLVGAAAPPVTVLTGLIPVFDLDGTLLDSDEALAAPFVALGVPRASVTFGHVVADECRRLGLSLSSYVARYDVGAAAPFPGVEEMVRGLRGRPWAVCSNKVRSCAVAELERLGWSPTVALFASDFGGGPKRLGPVLEALGGGTRGEDVVFVGDTEHDRSCAAAVGSSFAWAGWNPRVARAASQIAEDDAVLLRSPSDLFDVLGG